MLNAEYAIVIKSKTRLERLLEQDSTKRMARFRVESQGGDFSDFEAEHEVYHESLSAVQNRLSKVLRNKLVDRSFVPSYLFKGDIPLVIVIGQDGLVANSAKYVGSIPMIAVNPEPQRYDGVLLPFTPEDFLEAVEQVIAGKYKAQMRSLAEARLNDGQRLLAFNDLFIGTASHISARYRIQIGDMSEEQSSSGIIVSTKSGATGWLSSIFNMANGLQRLVTPQSKRKKRNRSQATAQSAHSVTAFAQGVFDDDSQNTGFGPRPMLRDDQLFFAVREPFQSQCTGIDIMGGPLDANDRLIIESHMPRGGVIFSDGMESDFLQFSAGNIATIAVAPEKAKLVQKR